MNEIVAQAPGACLFSGRASAVDVQSM